MKKILASALAVMMLFSTMAVSASATTTLVPKSEAALFLDAYLSNLKAGNVSTAYASTNNARQTLNEEISLTTLSAEEQDYVEYVESGDRFADLYAEEPIIDYTVLGEAENNIVTAELIFENGSEAIVPFRVVPSGNTYEVVYSLDDIDDLGYVETKAPTQTDNGDVDLLATGTWKDDYEFTYLYGTIYGLDTFSVSKNAIRIDGYQANYMLSSGWTSKAEVIYAVVVEHWYGDDVWATTNNSIVKNGSFSITIVGESSSKSNLKIRISNQTGANPRSEGNGSLYSVTV